jgi:hypothetical protein
VPHTVTREVKLSRPLARVAPLFERIRALLDRWPLTAPVCGVAVEVTATAAASGEQGGLFDLAWRDPAAVDAALDRLRAELGPNVVVLPVARDEHRPERAGAWGEEAGGAPPGGRAGAAPPPPHPGAGGGGPPARAGGRDGGSGGEDPAALAALRAALGMAGDVPAGAAPRGAPASAPASATGATGATAAPLALAEDGGGTQVAAPAALRLLEAPERVEVDAHGPLPGVMRWRGRHVALERAVGPERLSGDWWRDGFRRDYWRCTGDGATEFLLYRAEDGRWFLHGWYD